MPPHQAHPSASGLSQLVGELRPELLRFLTARLGDRAEAEEVVQDLWVRVCGVADGPVANGRAYLYRAAQNLALDRIRERRRRTARDGEWAKAQGDGVGGAEAADPRPHAEAALLEREQATALAAAIAALPEAAGRAFRMHKLDGMPHAEVARVLGISRSGVEKHMALAMAQLRRTLGD